MPNQLGSSEAVTKQGRGMGRISWKGSAYGRDAEVACWDCSSCHRLLAERTAPTAQGAENRNSHFLKSYNVPDTGGGFIPSIMTSTIASLLHGPSFSLAK